MKDGEDVTVSSYLCMDGSLKNRIAKNTLFLYFRMIVLMAVTLYTSRVVLKTLGIDSYGIYNLVAGFVILLSFFNQGLATGLQRYVNYALGHEDKVYERQVYSSGLRILAVIGLVIFLILETVGMWVLNTYLDIPEGSLVAANVVYQVSIVNFLVDTLRIPDEAVIRAHERMSFYSYISIVEAVLKLLILFLLVTMPFDKLILYSILVLGVTIIINNVYRFYVIRQFNLRFDRTYNKEITRELTTFSGWNIFGSIADIGYQQGTNIILNIFYGVALNATMGITNQVKNAVYNFVRNILVASNPQIFQLHSKGLYEEFRQLVLSISKYAYFMFLLIALPLIYNMSYLLNVWLTDVPPMGTTFCILIIIFCMIDSLNGPLWTAAQADANIKKYQIVTGIILLMNLPGTYLVFHFGMSPQWMLYVQIFIVIVSLIYRVVYLHRLGLISNRIYLKDVILPITTVTVISLLLICVINRVMPFDGLKRLFINTPVYLIVIAAVIYLFGTTKSEKIKVRNFANKICGRFSR